MPEIPKTYEPHAIEEKWYAFWEEHGCFAADAHSKKPAYSIVIPPPNVTGILTLGHVLNNTIQDILARRARMEGKEVLWLPGTDHAGIATQTVVERALKKEGTIKHRDDLGREKFVGKVWEWKEKHGGIIIQQLKKLGASCDWTRQRFTMDPAYSECVSRVFVDLYKKGLIFRGKRMVNWDPVSLTALSDEEVVMKPQNGTMYHFQAEVAESPGTFVTIATTRPETIPGDTAVAVNPKDPRYTNLIGRHVIRPLPEELPREKKLIPIIADAQVEFEFGTGVLKVTPAHDKADFEIGQRHGLAPVEIMDAGGKMNPLAGQALAGLDRFEARGVAIERLRELGALIKEEPYQHNVGFSERTDVPIEPRLSEQWWLRYPSREAAHRVVTAGRMGFYPERWVKVYDHWMTNLQDWCISRQLWWGHRVPVWYHQETGAVHCAVEPPSEPDGWVQDPDVLDTWFSSWLWPFATMGWPDKTDTLAKFYPTTDLVTGPDIIFFWVARMIMAGFEFMGEMPFRNVYFTGIIRDKQGRKMSKSLGNSPDPLDLIARYGADALRFGVMRSAPLGQDVLYDEKNVELGRNFCTKLWNACRFRQMQNAPGTFDGPPTFEDEINPSLLTTDDQWILLRLDAAIREVSAALEEYRFSDAASALYRFFWSEFCDWYLEASKAALGRPADQTTETLEGAAPSASREPLGKSPSPSVSSASSVVPSFPPRANTLAVIDFVLGHTLRLFHPFLPFITEELWQGMGFSADLPPDQGGRTIMSAHWPAPFDADFRSHYRLTPDAENAANAKYQTVILGRGLRRDFSIPSNKRVRFVLVPRFSVDVHDASVLRILLNASVLDLPDEYSPPRGTPAAVTPLGDLFLPLEGVLDIGAERERLGKEIARVTDELAKVRTKLANPTFTGKVPASVLEEHQQREANWAEKLAQLERMRSALAE